MLTTAALEQTSLTDTIGRYFIHTVRNCHQVQRNFTYQENGFDEFLNKPFESKDANLNQREN